MEFLLLWIILGVVVALVARSKGRSGLGRFLYGLLIWPVAPAHILLVARTPEAEEKRARSSGRAACPHGAEFIKPQARVCPHCRQSL